MDLLGGLASTSILSYLGRGPRADGQPGEGIIGGIQCAYVRGGGGNGRHPRPGGADAELRLPVVFCSQQQVSDTPTPRRANVSVIAIEEFVAGHRS
jgi:hypothetical protein